jgi:phosphoglucosamine mutase
MGKYFGTDGVRGLANQELTAEMAFRIGLALGHLYQGQKIVCGRDTRLSGTMLKNSLAAGVCSGGANLYDLGVVSTPVIAHLCVHEDFACGVMISASHNPFADNGIKVFNHQGMKIDDAIEAQIEAVMDGQDVKRATPEQVGQVMDYPAGIEHYLNHLRNLFQMDLSGLKIAVDAANGSAVSTAETILKALKAKPLMMHHQPDGKNINTNCGSTHPESLQAFVKEHGCDIGLAFDGDADRLIAVDHEGHLVDGDAMLYILGSYMKKHQQLSQNVVVSTVMSNLGFYKALERRQIHSEKTQVGDKYVNECMITEGYDLGGEQSGHIIFRRHATTGDGLLTALKLIEVMIHEQQSLVELRQDLHIYPQTLKNVRVKDKKQVIQNPELQAFIQSYETQLQGEGRILVRPSGTEPLVRVMVEAKEQSQCDAIVDEMIAYIQNLEG